MGHSDLESNLEVPGHLVTVDYYDLWQIKEFMDMRVSVHRPYSTARNVAKLFHVFFQWNSDKIIRHNDVAERARTH